MPTRQKLAASAYAFQAENANYATTAGTATTASNADTLDGLHAAAFGQLDGTNTWTGTNLFKPTTNSATALQVQNAAGAVVLGVNTIAGTTILGSLAADPTAPNSANGALYYNTATNKLRCYENGAWANCAASAANVIQNQYASLQTANYFIQSANNTTAAATIQAASGQTGAVFRVLDSGGTARFWVNGVGDFQTATQNNNLGGLQIGGTYGAHTSMLDIITRSAATTGLTIKASTSQTAPLIVLQDSTGTEVARINADGSNNTAFGKISLQNNPGSGNTAFGALTLSQQTSGINNTALGYNAMGNGAVTAQNNTGVGVSSLQTITSGSANTGIGAQAGFSLTTGDANTALGFQTLLYNQTGERNVAIGYQALSGTNTTAGTGNIGIGYLTGNVLTSGDYNIMIGDAAGRALVSGSSNTFIGDFAGYNDGGFTAATLQRATAIGVEAVVQQDNSMVLGSIGTTTRVGIGTTKPAELLSVAPPVYNTGTASATTAGAVTGTGTTWTNGNNIYVGDTIIFANGVSGTITAINSATSLTISPNPAAAVANQYYRIHRGGLNVTQTGDTYLKQTSATAFQVQNASGTNVFTVDTTGTGMVKLNGQNLLTATSGIQNQYAAIQTANFFIQSANNTTAAASIQAASGQTGAVLRVLDSGGTARFWVNGVGDFQTATQNNNLGGLQIGGTYGAHTSMLDIITRSAATTGLTIKASASQTAPLIVLQDSAGTETARINSVYGGTYFGFGSGQSVTASGVNNTAMGTESMLNLTSGVNNASFGYEALRNNQIGGENTAIGMYTLLSGTNINGNTAVGWSALQGATGDYNTALGRSAGYKDSWGAFVTRTDNYRSTAIGAYAQVQQSDSLVLGSIDNNTRIGIGTTKPSQLFSISPKVYSTGTASQSGTTVTGVGTTWGNGTTGPVYVGDTIIFADGTSATVTGTITNTTLVVGTSQTVASQAYRIHRGGFNVAQTGDTYIKQTSTTAFQIQNASGAALFTADTVNSVVTIGSAGNTLTISSSGGITAAGTARKTKKITLNAEYAGAVLDATSDSSCSAAYNGTMTAAYDETNRMNSYLWTTTQATNQCFDVVVQVPIPSDFSAWAASDPINVKMKTDNTTNSSYAIKIIDSTGTADTNYNYSAPGTLSTSWSDMATTGFTGTYTAGDYMTIKLRMTAKSSAQLQAGNIVLTYLSSF